MIDNKGEYVKKSIVFAISKHNLWKNPGLTVLVIDIFKGKSSGLYGLSLVFMNFHLIITPMIVQKASY